MAPVAPTEPRRHSAALPVGVPRPSIEPLCPPATLPVGAPRPSMMPGIFVKMFDAGLSSEHTGHDLDWFVDLLVRDDSWAVRALLDFEPTREFSRASPEADDCCNICGGVLAAGKECESCAAGETIVMDAPLSGTGIRPRTPWRGDW